MGAKVNKKAQKNGHLDQSQVAIFICHDLWDEKRLVIDSGI
jgi:hypothetical protein